MANKTVLVVGGAGYIGSHMSLFLNEQGFTPIVVDNLSSGHYDAVIDCEFFIADIADSHTIERILKKFNPLAVMHFASCIQVNESMKNPAKYYKNNLCATINLLDCMLKLNIHYFIFSSSAAVYGEPVFTPINESHPLQPINPYGRTKYMIEKILQDYTLAYGLKYSSLRYFNVAGLDPLERLKEQHNPETHLIPLLLEAAYDKTKIVYRYGGDYSTPDGTCIRDYIHVTDLCQAHFLALEQLCAKNSSSIYNLGTGKGYSVQEIINTIQTVTGKELHVVDSPRRAGDPAILICDPSFAQQELGWQLKYSNLTTIIKHAAKGFIKERITH